MQAACKSLLHESRASNLPALPPESQRISEVRLPLIFVMALSACAWAYLLLALLAASCSRAGGQQQLPLEAALEAARRVEVGSPREFIEALQLTDPTLRLVLTGGRPALHSGALRCTALAARPCCGQGQKKNNQLLQGT